MKVFLNAGHAPNGVPDTGAVNPITGLTEAIVTHEVAGLAERYLSRAGIECRLLQSDSLSEIVRTANLWQADIFVSIHCNAAVNIRARGTETYYYHGSRAGRELARALQLQIITSLATIDRGIKESSFYVIKHTAMPATLVELAFISNEWDEILLATRQDDFAAAIARGVTDYQLRQGG